MEIVKARATENCFLCGKGIRHVNKRKEGNTQVEEGKA
jgi:hypothetical protein